MIEIRRATDHAVKGIVRVGRISFTWTFAHLFTAGALERYLDATYSSGKILASLSKPNNVYFVAEVDGVLAAFLKLKRHCSHHLIPDARQWQVQKIYVLPDFADKGVGSKLMEMGERTL